MDAKLINSQRKGSLNVQEMCRKFESSGRQHSASESEIQVRVKSSAIYSPSATPKLPSHTHPQPRIETQWSKGKTQHHELMQKRQLQKQHMQKLSPEHSPMKSTSTPKPFMPVKNFVTSSSPPKNGSCNDSPASSNLVMQRMRVFETSSPLLPPKPLVQANQSNGHAKRLSHNEDQFAKPPKPEKSSDHINVYFAQNPAYEELPPPKKPPRTFAHNRYIENKVMQPLPANTFRGALQNQALYRQGQSQNPVCPQKPPSSSPSYRSAQPETSPVRNSIYRENAFIQHPSLKPKPVFVDLTATTLGPPKNYGTLKRSFSEEHVYADPYETIYAQHHSKNGSNLAGHDYAKPCNGSSPTGNLHYMSSPVMNVSNCQNSSRTLHNMKGLPTTKPGKSFTPNVRDMINHTFGQLWRKLHYSGGSDGLDVEFPEDVAGDSGSEVSVKDVQERLIYVRSLKKRIINISRLENSQHLFDGLTVCCLTPARKDSAPKPRLIFQFPKEVETEYQGTMIPQICFSDASSLKASSTYKSETFLFAVEDEQGEKMFGYCLRLLGSTPSPPASAYITLPAVICLLTSRNSPAFYLKVLMEIEKHLLLPEAAFCRYISKLYQVQVPLPGAKLSLPDFIEGGIESSLLISCPSDNRIVNAELTLLLQRLEVDLLLKVLASLLLERKVLLVASHSSTLFKCTTGILSLLYPLSWQHNSIPVLPNCLLSQCLSSSPYLHGVSSMAVHRVLEMLKEKILVIDLDQSQVLKEVGDEHTILPNRISKTVRYALSLAKNMTDPTEMMRDLMIAEAFIRMFIELLGHCDQHIVENPSETFTFMKEPFCKAPSSRGVQMFLQWFSETQMFEYFIEERLQMKRTQHIRKQPGLNIPMGLFDRRLQEYWNHQNQSGHRLRENVRELGKKVRTFGEKIKKAF